MHPELLFSFVIPFAIASLIYLIFRRIRFKRLNENKTKYTLDYCLGKSNNSEFESYESLMDYFYKEVIDSCNEFDVLFKKLKYARYYKKKRKETGIGILDAVNSFFETPNQERFTKVDSLYFDLRSQLKSINFHLKRMRDVRLDFRALATKEMECISVIINCFSNKLSKYDVKLKRDKDVGTYSLEINSDNLWQELHSDEGNDSSLGLSLIESGNRLGGVGGAGIIAVGALTAVGQLITEKADKEARYSEGVAQRVKDIKALANEKEKALALSNELYELTVPLKECHKIYVAELETIAATYESGIDEKLIKALVKLSKVYNAMNKNVAKGK